MNLGRVKVFPSPSVGDAGHLRAANTNLFCEKGLRPPPTYATHIYDRNGLFFVDFGCNANDAVLHRAVPAHVGLVISVSRPSKIADPVIPRRAVFMCNVAETLRVGYERQGDQAMDQPLHPVLRAWCSKLHSAVTTLIGNRTHELCVAAPCRPNFTRTGNFVIGESVNLLPHSLGL